MVQNILGSQTSFRVQIDSINFKQDLVPLIQQGMIVFSEYNSTGKCFAELECQQGTNEAGQSMLCPEIQWLNQNERTDSTI